MPSERPSLRRWVIAGVVVLGAHIGVAAALGAWMSPTESAGGPKNAVLIDMVAFASESAAVAQSESQPQPQPNPEPREKPESPQPPTPQPEPVPEPDPIEPEPLPEPEPVPEPEPIEPEPIEPDPIPEPEPKPEPPPLPEEKDLVRNEAEPQQVAAAQQKVRQPQDAVGSSGEVVTWQGRLARHLERHKRYPRAARRRDEQGTAAVKFTMNRSGEVQDCRLVRSSGHGSLDTAACELVFSAQPLPPPPGELPGETLSMTVPVDYSLR